MIFLSATEATLVFSTTVETLFIVNIFMVAVNILWSLAGFEPVRVQTRPATIKIIKLDCLSIREQCTYELYVEIQIAGFAL